MSLRHVLWLCVVCPVIVWFYTMPSVGFSQASAISLRTGQVVPALSGSPATLGGSRNAARGYVEQHLNHIGAARRRRIRAAASCLVALPSTIASTTELKATPCATYLSNGTVVQTGATLTVDPGVTVEFSGGTLDVQGKLLAQGTASQTITFTSAYASPAPGDWGGIYLEHLASAVFSYATISYAGSNPYLPAALYLVGATASFAYGTVSASYTDGIVSDSTSTLSVTNSTISANRNDGVNPGSAATTLKNDSFSSNGNFAVELGTPDAMAGAANNSFTGNGFDGIFLDSGSVTKSATWAASAGPVELGGTITVLNNITLSLPANETLYCISTSFLDVQGNLTALGTATQPVTFTSAYINPVPGDWTGIQLEAGATTNLSYTMVLDGGSSPPYVPAAVVLIGAKGTFSHVTIANSGSAGISVDSKSTLSATYSTMQNNTGDGISAANAAPLIQNDTISGNTGYGVELADPDAMPTLAADTYSGNGFDGIYLDGGNVTKSATWNVTAGAVELGGTITVNSNATLTVPAGEKIVATYSLVDVKGVLRATGTAALPITFTSAAVKPAAGDWGGLRFEPGASGALSYVSILFAGQQNYAYAALALSGSAVTGDHLIINAAKNYGIYADSGSVLTITSSTISNSTVDGVYVPDGASSVTITGSTVSTSHSEGIVVAGSATKLQGDTFTLNRGTAIELSSPDAMTGLATNTYSGNGFNGIYLDGGSVTKTANWRADAGPVRLLGEVTINSAITLTLLAGERFTAVSGTGLDVKGSLNAPGTAAQPITFNGVYGVPAPGDWSGLNFEVGATGAMTYTTIIGAGTALNLSSSTLSFDHGIVSTNSGYGAYTDGGSALSVTNSTISANRIGGIYAAEGGPVIRGDTFSKNGGDAVELVAPDALGGLSSNAFGGNGFNGVYLDGGVVTKSVTWSPAADGVIEFGGTVTVNSGVTLNVGAGQNVMVATCCSGFELDVHGTLSAQGTASQPVTFTSATASPAPGYWAGIALEQGASASLTYAVISYASDGINAAAGSTLSATYSTMASNYGGVVAATPTVTLHNDTFSNNVGDAVEFADPSATAGLLANSFGGNGFDGVYLDGGTMTKSATWAPSADGSIELGSTIAVNSGITLSVGAGQKVLVAACCGAALDMHGVLSVQGSASQPVTFTSAAASPASWAGIVLEKGASATLSYATIAYAGGGYTVTVNSTNIGLSGGLSMAGASATLSYVTISASTYGIDAEAGSTVNGANSTFTNDSTAVNVSSSNVTITTSAITNDGFGVANCAGCTPVRAQNDNWGDPHGPAPFGPGPGVSYHQVNVCNPTTNVCTTENALDVIVQPWVGESSLLRPINGPSPNPGGGGNSPVQSQGGQNTFDLCGPLGGSCNDDTVTSGEPVNTATGSYEYSHTDLALAGRMPLMFSRTYNSLTAAASPGPLGYGWTFSYGASLASQSGGATVVVTFGTGRTDVFTKQSGGTYTAAPGQFDTLAVNSDLSYDVLDKQQTDYHFSPFGVLTSITDHDGNVAALSYNASNHLQSVSAAGRSLTFTYTSAGQIATVTDNSGRQISFTYSSTTCTPSCDLVGVKDPRGQITVYAYDGSHQMLSGVDRNGHTFVRNVYDSSGHVVLQLNALGAATTYAYYPASGATVVTDPRHGVTTYTYNSQYQLISMVDALGNTYTYTYDTSGDLLTSTDPNSHTYTYTYDARGNMLTSKDPLGHLTKYAYDARNRPLTKVDPLGYLTTYAYDSHENLVSATDPLANVTRHTYDAQGDLLTVADPLMHTTTYGYDGAGDRTSATDPLSNTTTTAYDAVGRPISVTDPLSDATTTTYDADDRITAVTDPLSNTTSYTYDAEGNKLGVTDPRGHTTTYSYDALDELAQVKDANGGITTYKYDATGNRIAVTDALAHTTTTAYDLLHRVTGVTDPLGRTVKYGYDAAGNLASVTNARGSTINYGYDADNRRNSIGYANGSTVSYTYYANGPRATMTDSTGTTRYYYDKDSRVITVAQPAGAVTYTYDGTGNRLSMIVPGNKKTSYAYDAGNRLITITDWRGGISTVQYDASGRPIGRSLANGVTATYNYDKASRDLSVAYSANSSPLANFSYTYDADGNRLSATDTNGTTNYTYDALNRLTIARTSVVTTTYTYDVVGNRTKMTVGAVSTGYTYDAANEMLSAGTATYKYDADGNRISAVSGGFSTSYSYDDANYLTGITTGTQSTMYSYNGDHARVGSVVGTTATSEVLDLAAPLPQVVQSKVGTLLTTYLYGDGLLAQDNGTAEQFLLADGLGSVRLVTGAGAVAGTASYDPYGAQTASGTTSTFGFTGQQADAESGLVYLRARMYDPATGVFLQRDTFPFESANPASLNRYTYADDNPLSLTDPSGKVAGWDDLAAIGLGAAGGLGEQFISDTLEGKYHSWQYYAASAVGGAVSGETELLIEETSAGAATPVSFGIAGGAGSLAQQATLDLLQGHLSSLNTYSNSVAQGALYGEVFGPVAHALGGGNDVVETLAGSEMAGVADWLLDQWDEWSGGARNSK